MRPRRPGTLRRCVGPVVALAGTLLVGAAPRVAPAQLPGTLVRSVPLSGCDPAHYTSPFVGSGACGTGVLRYYQSPGVTPPLLLVLGTFDVTSPPGVIARLLATPPVLVPPSGEPDPEFDGETLTTIAPPSWTPSQLRLAVGYIDPSAYDSSLPPTQQSFAASGTITFSPVPEPATLGTVAVGALLLALGRRRSVGADR